jgi:hypothetical protein
MHVICQCTCPASQGPCRSCRTREAGGASYHSSARSGALSPRCQPGRSNFRQAPGPTDRSDIAQNHPRHGEPNSGRVRKYPAIGKRSGLPPALTRYDRCSISVACTLPPNSARLASVSSLRSRPCITRCYAARRSLAWDPGPEPLPGSGWTQPRRYNSATPVSAASRSISWSWKAGSRACAAGACRCRWYQ